MRSFNPLEWVYGGIAKLINEQSNPIYKTIYRVLLSVIYFQITVYVLEAPTVERLMFGLIATINIVLIIYYDLKWLQRNQQK